MQKHIKSQLKTINKMFRRFDSRMSASLVDECLSALNSGHKIIGSALGKNVPICDKFISTLNSLGIDSHFLHTHTATHGDLGLVKPGDLVILLSKSGETPETIYLAKLLKKKGTNNWLLTCNKNSTTSKHVKNTVVLPIDHECDPWNLVPITSTVVFLIFLNGLSLELVDKLKIPLSILKDNHPGGSIGKSLRSTK